MKLQEFINCLSLEHRILSITRSNQEQNLSKLNGGCTLKEINRVLDGETIVYNSE